MSKRARVALVLSLGLGGFLFFGLVALVSGLLYFSYRPDAAANVLCQLGSQDACNSLAQQANTAFLTFLAFLLSSLLTGASLLASGIVTLALVV